MGLEQAASPPGCTLTAPRGGPTQQQVLGLGAPLWDGGPCFTLGNEGQQDPVLGLSPRKAEAGQRQGNYKLWCGLLGLGQEVEHGIYKGLLHLSRVLDL